MANLVLRDENIGLDKKACLGVSRFHRYNLSVQCRDILSLRAGDLNNVFQKFLILLFEIQSYYYSC